MPERADGPWDVSEVDMTIQRLDLGGLLVAPIEGVEVQLQADQESGQVVQLTLARPDGGVQVQPFAAPRSGGLWDTVRPQLKTSVNSAGGLVEEAEGPFGVELRAQVSAEGGKALQPARFAGIDGPRWFLRAVFLGAAARPGEAADVLERAVRNLVVVRGTDAMPMGAPIPMRVPESSTASEELPAAPPSPFGGTEPHAARARIALPARGPEITETR